MTRETAPNSEAVVSEFERDSLRPLIEHSLESMELEPGQANSNLYAMINAYRNYGFGMPRSTTKHLRRMIVLNSKLISDELQKEDNILAASIRAAMHTEYIEYDGFSEDLSDMTEPWRAALDDVQALLSDLDGSKSLE